MTSLANTAFHEQILASLFADNDAAVYLNTLMSVSPVFVSAVIAQVEGISDRRLGELLGVDHILDAKAIKIELQKLNKQSA